jgi:hypothetical protein
MAVAVEHLPIVDSQEVLVAQVVVVMVLLLMLMVQMDLPTLAVVLVAVQVVDLTEVTVAQEL